MKKLVWLVIYVIVLTGCGEKKSELPVVAVVGDREIPLYRISENFEQVGMPEFVTAEEELAAKEKYLQEQIEEQLLIKAAYAHGFDTDLEVLELVERERDKFLLDELFRVEIIDKVNISEKELRKNYEHWFTRIRARHILVPTKAQADSVYAELTNGADFAKLARDVSQDPLSARRGGDLGRQYAWGDLVEPFQSVVFGMNVGELSKPVKTEYGWHIIELLEKKDITSQPFDQVRERIEAKLKSEKQKERQLEHRQELKQKYPIELDLATLEYLKGKVEEYAQFDTLVLADSLRRDVPLDYLSDLDAEKPFARYLNDQVITLGQYLTSVNQMPPEMKPSLDSPAAVEDHIFDQVLLELLIDQAKSLGLEEAELYTRRMKQFTESVMAEKLRNSILHRQVSVSDSEMRTYYAAHPDQFYSDLRMRISEIQFATKKDAMDLRPKLRPDNFANLAAKHTIRKGYKRKKGDLGYIKDYRWPEIWAVAETLDVGKISQPFVADEDWSIIRVTERELPELRTYDDIRDDLYTNMRDFRIDSTYTAYVDSLKSTTTVTVFDDLLTKTVDKEKYQQKQ